MVAYLRGSATPPPVAPPIYTSWKRVTHLFHGWDGSVWDVTDGRNGVYLMPEGIEGMGMPNIQNYTFDSPVVHGFEWEGWRATGRDVHWVIGIFEDSSEDWIKMKHDFWRIFRPGKVMRWEVILPTNERYSINVRFKSDDTSVYYRDPVKLGWAIYGITGICEQPFWEGDTQAPIWFPRQAAAGGFYGTTGFGPPFNIESSNDIATAKINNPGDVEAYVRWQLTGPFSTATVGIGLLTATVGTTGAGSIVEIDTNPTSLTATRDGVDIMPELGSFEFAPIPPGTDILLSLSMTGAGSTQAFFTPLYLRSV